MGVLNITEDSSSDGGLWLDPGKARDHGDDMLHAGADIIDIGAESTRPGAKRVSEKVELDRVTGAAKALIAHGAVVSIDTTRSAVAQAALDEGAQIINDVSGGRLDRDLPHVGADHDCLYIVQHWRGWLAGSKGGAAPDADTSHYEHDVLKDVYDELMRQVDAVLEAGVQAEQVIIDPGLGFSKPGIEHNLPLLVGLDMFKRSGYPVLIGASRKRFVSAALNDAGIGEPTMDDRDNVTAALSALCAEHGAWTQPWTRFASPAFKAWARTACWTTSTSARSPSSSMPCCISTCHVPVPAMTCMTRLITGASPNGSYPSSKASMST